MPELGDLVLSQNNFIRIDWEVLSVFLYLSCQFSQKTLPYESFEANRELFYFFELQESIC